MADTETGEWELPAIVRRVMEVRRAQEEAAEEEALNWRRFYEIGDDIAGPGQKFRYFNSELGKGMERVITCSAPTVDLAMLQATLTTAEWQLCTRPERVFNMELLEKALAAGKIRKAAVEGATRGGGAGERKHFIEEPTRADKPAARRAK